MVLFPTRTKFKKSHRRLSKLKQTNISYNTPVLGYSGLKALKPFRITAVQIEAVRKVVIRLIKKKYNENIKNCIFPDLPVTKKSLGIRMGKGKGSVEYWSFLVKPGRILFELSNKKIPLAVIYKSFSVAIHKLPGKYSIII